MQAVADAVEAVKPEVMEDLPLEPWFNEEDLLVNEEDCSMPVPVMEGEMTAASSAVDSMGRVQAMLDTECGVLLRKAKAVLSKAETWSSSNVQI